MLEVLRNSPLAAFAVALVIAFAVTPVVRLLALRFEAVARPDARRIHKGFIPQWGGISIFLGVLVAALIWRQPSWQDVRQLAPSAHPSDIAATAQTLHLTTTFFLTGGLMLLLGMADDKWELKAWQKTLGQVLIGCLLWAGGIKITTVPFTAGTQLLSDPASLTLTLIWVLALTNGVNFIDGVDGLASGVCAIAAASLCLIELDKAPWAAAAAAALCGASLGFLRFNFYPAKIFLGDSGALLLGFWLAAISLAAAAKAAAATTLALPLLILGIPLFDITWAASRRILAGQPPWRADRGHIHHRLLSRGFSPLTTALVLYGVALVLGAAAYLWSNI